jgi:lipid-A-disaccharide synthase
VLVLIDYPGFNLRFARIAKRYGVKIVYYISPQVWAWHRSRVKKIRSLVDKMLVIFPFEEEFYKAEGVDAEFIGHPLLEVLDAKLDRSNFCRRFSFDDQKPIVALLPGSRKQEIDSIFPEMLSAARIMSQQKNAQIVIALAPTLEEEYLRTLYQLDGILVIKGLTYEVMANADFAFVTSGTATLETACFATPMMVVYRTSWLTYLIGRMLVRVKNIGLVNIVAGKRIVPEFIQHKAHGQTMAAAAMDLMNDTQRLAEMKKELSKVKELLGTVGASQRVAERILQMK